jgi:hypothetical protein
MVIAVSNHGNATTLTEPQITARIGALGNRPAGSRASWVLERKITPVGSKLSSGAPATYALFAQAVRHARDRR